MVKTQRKPEIPNLDIGKTYDHRNESADIHIDTLHNLSDFFGLDMPAHRHDRFYQVHLLLSGSVELLLGDQSYGGAGPLYFFTPPSVPHSFRLDADVSGLVLTVRQDAINRIVAGSDDGALKRRFSVPIFNELNAVGGALARDAARLPQFMQLLAEEFYETRPGRKHTLPALANLVLVSVFRLSHMPERTEPLRRVELEIFQAFNELIEAHYRQHWSLTQYATELNVTQGRLADICRRLSGSSPKALVFERQIHEARWQLIYTTTAINMIADKLGFVDPAYFCRFFTTHTGLSPSEFRRRMLLGGTNR